MSFKLTMIDIRSDSVILSVYSHDVGLVKVNRQTATDVPVPISTAQNKYFFVLIHGDEFITHAGRWKIVKDADYALSQAMPPPAPRTYCKTVRINDGIRALSEYTSAILKASNKTEELLENANDNGQEGIHSPPNPDMSSESDKAENDELSSPAPTEAVDLEESDDSTDEEDVEDIPSTPCPVSMAHAISISEQAQKTTTVLNTSSEQIASGKTNQEANTSNEQGKEHVTSTLSTSIARDSSVDEENEQNESRVKDTAEILPTPYRDQTSGHVANVEASDATVEHDDDLNYSNPSVTAGCRSIIKPQSLENAFSLLYTSLAERPGRSFSVFIRPPNYSSTLSDQPESKEIVRNEKSSEPHSTSITPQHTELSELTWTALTTGTTVHTSSKTSPKKRKSPDSLSAYDTRPPKVPRKGLRDFDATSQIPELDAAADNIEIQFEPSQQLIIPDKIKLTPDTFEQPLSSNEQFYTLARNYTSDKENNTVATQAFKESGVDHSTISDIQPRQASNKILTNKTNLQTPSGLSKKKRKSTATKTVETPQRSSHSGRNKASDDVKIEATTPRTRARSDSVISQSDDHSLLNTPRVTFSSSCTLDKEAYEQFKKIGGEKTNDIHKADILCVSNNNLSRTPKYLLASLLNKIIVNERWIIDSIKHRSFVATSEYLPKVKVKEKKWNLTLKAAHDRSKSPDFSYRKLLQDKKVYMTKAMVAGLRHQHNLDDFTRIVTPCGTTAYPRFPKKSNRSPISTLVLGVENDHEVVDLRKSGHTLYTKEAVIMAVLRGKLELDTEEFKVALPIKAEPPSP